MYIVTDLNVCEHIRLRLDRIEILIFRYSQNLNSGYALFDPFGWLDIFAPVDVLLPTLTPHTVSILIRLSTFSFPSTQADHHMHLFSTHSGKQRPTVRWTCVPASRAAGQQKRSGQPPSPCTTNLGTGAPLPYWSSTAGPSIRVAVESSSSTNVDPFSRSSAGPSSNLPSAPNFLAQQRQHQVGTVDGMAAWDARAQ